MATQSHLIPWDNTTKVNWMRIYKKARAHAKELHTTTLKLNYDELEQDMFSFPLQSSGSILLDNVEKILYLADKINGVVRKIDLYTKESSILCGKFGEYDTINGERDHVRFQSPSGMALDSKRKMLYVSDSSENVIRRIDLNPGENYGFTVTCFGEVTDNNRKCFQNPNGLVFDSFADDIYVADRNNNQIKRISLETGEVFCVCYDLTLWRRGGKIEGSFFDRPHILALDPKTRNLYIGGPHYINVLSLETARMWTLYESSWFFPTDMILDYKHQCLYVADAKDCVWKLSLAKNDYPSIFCGMMGRTGSTDGPFPLFNSPKGITIDPTTGYVYVMDANGLREISPMKRRTPTRTLRPRKLEKKKKRTCDDFFDHSCKKSKHEDVPPHSSEM